MSAAAAAGPGADETRSTASRRSDPEAARALGRTDLWRVAAARAAVSACLLVLGFRAVSDDDFARVVIAEEWAGAPKLDPSGTSWLPFPFWVSGAAMLVLGRSLLVARAVAFVLGVGASLLIAIAAQRITSDRRAAVITGLASALVGWAAWLGVATVPELVTAALTLFAASSLVTRSAADRLWGALALVAATLSRYEPWPVAIAFAAWAAASPPVDEGAAPGSRSSARRWLGRLGPAAIALAGPAAWIGWNRVAHGDAFHFVARVAAYHRAVGQASNDGVVARLAAYPAAFASEMPEVLLAAIVVLGIALAAGLRGRAWIAQAARRSAAPLVLAGAQVAALSISLVKDGAPTHHPERALLFPALALVVFLADVASRVAAERPRWRTAGAICAVVLLARAVMMPVLARAEAEVRSVRGGWMLLLPAPRERFADRRAETAIGAAIAEVLGPAATGSKAYLEGVRDYGYFAVLAGTGRPERVVLSRGVDPRSPGEEPAFESEARFLEWLRGQGIGLVIGRVEGGEVRERFGRAPVRLEGGYGIWVVPGGEAAGREK